MRKRIDTKIEHTEPLHIKYRPKAFADVVGQDTVVKGLQGLLAARARPHVFLFSGPSGTGKTTLARIMAAALDCDARSTIERDAASYSGIDEVRELTAGLRYSGFGTSPGKAIIIDEAHNLSPKAWEGLLAITEHPPEHVFFFFCTTNAKKMPAAMLTRCQGFNLKPVAYADIIDLLEGVCDAEGYQTPTEILAKVAQSCQGSPRMALTMLANVYATESTAEVMDMLETMEDSKEVIDLCRMLVAGKLQWPSLCKVLKDLSNQPAESIRIVVVNYLSACLLSAKSDKDAIRLLGILECFMKPCNPADKNAGLLIAFGRYVYP